MTRDEAIAACRALGVPLAACVENVNEQTLPDGTFCDGAIVRELGADGRAVARCVTAAQMAAKRAQAEPPRLPSTASPSSPIPTLAVVAGVAFVAWILLRR